MNIIAKIMELEKKVEKLFCLITNGGNSQGGGTIITSDNFSWSSSASGDEGVGLPILENRF